MAALRGGHEEEVASIVCNNPRVAQEYSDKTAALADVTTREEAARTALAAGAQEVEDLKVREGVGGSRSVCGGRGATRRREGWKIYTRGGGERGSEGGWRVGVEGGGGGAGPGGGDRGSFTWPRPAVSSAHHPVPKYGQPLLTHTCSVPTLLPTAITPHTPCLTPAPLPPCPLPQAAWLPELQQVVSSINASFSTNFAHIGCAGEVVLVEHADFDKYAMEVRRRAARGVGLRGGGWNE